MRGSDPRCKSSAALAPKGRGNAAEAASEVAACACQDGAGKSRVFGLKIQLNIGCCKSDVRARSKSETPPNRVGC